MTEELSENVRRLIDGELEAADVAGVLRAVADDPTARELLLLEFTMRRAFEEEREAAWAVPSGFSERVMERVSRLSDRANALAAKDEKRTSWASKLLKALTTPRSVTLRPAFAVAFVVLLAVGLVLFRSDGRPAIDNKNTTFATAPTEVRSEEVLVPFVYVNGEASSVAVAGDFNGWEPTSLQPKNVEGRMVWTGLLPVSRGEHRYMFVIDGTRWESDPLAPVHRDDGFGNTNAILAL